MDDKVARYDATVSAIYDAALRPELLPDAMESVRRLLDCDIYHLYAWDVREQRPVRTWASLQASDPISRGYNTYYGLIDPRRVLAEARPVGDVFACTRHFDATYVASSEFYQDFLLPGGLRYNLAVALSRGGDREYKLGMLRALGRPDYTDDDVTLARRVAGHLSRALALMSRLQSFSSVADTQDHGFNSLDIALALLDERGRLVHLSPSGEAMLRRHGIGIGANGPALRGENRSTFEAAWQRVCSTGTPASFSLSGGGNKRALLATLMRVPDREGPAPATGVRFSLLFAEPQRRAATARAMREAFSLTRAEAELAHDLATGLSLAESAQRRGVRESTVRSQLVALFAKTGTHRQAELVQLLGRLPAAAG